MKNKTNNKGSKLSINKKVIKNYSGSKSMTLDFDSSISICQSANSSSIL